MKYWVGYYCPRGNGHYEFLADPEYDPHCRGRGWDLYLDAEMKDMDHLPAGGWVE